MTKVLLILFILLLFFGRCPALAEDEPPATIANHKGEVSIRRNGESRLIQATQNMKLFPGDLVWTGKKSYAAVLYKGGTVLKINESSTIQIPPGDSKTLLTLGTGEVWMKVRTGGEKVCVKTPESIVHIEGTELDIRFTGKAETILTLIRGMAVLESSGRSVNLKDPSTQSIALSGKTPGEPIALDVMSLIRWTGNIPVRVTYPRTLYYDDEKVRNKQKAALGEAVKKDRTDYGSLSLLGDILTDEDDLKHAENYYRKALNLNSRFIPAMTGLSYLYFLEGDYEKAEEFAQSALQADAESARAFYLRGLVSDIRGDDLSAITDYTRAVIHDPVNRDVLRNLGIDVRGQGYYELSGDIFRRLIALYPADPEGYVQLGINMMLQGKYEDAERYYGKAIEISPGDFRGWFNLGNIMEFKDDTFEAVKCYERALALDKDNIDAVNNLAALFYKMGKFEKACKWFERGKSIDPGNYQIANNLALCLIAMKDWKRAEETLAGAIAKNPDESTLHYNMGILKERKNDESGAISELQDALGLNPHDTHVRIKLSNLLIKKGRPGEALKVLRAGIALFPEDCGLLFNLGNLLYQRGEPDEAEKYLNACVKASPGSAKAFQLLGLIALKKGECETAEKMLQKAMELEPESSEAHNHMGVIYLNEQKLDMAEEELRNAIRLSESNAEAYSNLGLLYLRKGDTESALSKLKVALRLNPELAAAWSNLGLYNMMKGDIKSASINYEKAISLDKMTEDAYIGLGAAHYMSGDLKKAEVDYRRLLDINPKSCEALSSLGYVLYQEGDSSMALSYCSQAVKAGRDSATAHYNLAWAYRGTGKIPEAQKEWDEVIRISPDSWEGLTAAAYKAFYGNELEKAGELEEKAEKANPHNADIYFLKGLIKAKQGLKAQAEVEFRKALKEDPQHRDARAELEKSIH